MHVTSKHVHRMYCVGVEAVKIQFQNQEGLFEKQIVFFTRRKKIGGNLTNLYKLQP